jgi:hypothetical protein
MHLVKSLILQSQIKMHLGLAAAENPRMRGLQMSFSLTIKDKCYSTKDSSCLACGQYI